MALERLDDGMFVATSPLSFLGLRIGTRMTIVRLEGGGLWVHSPLELTPDLRAGIDALGPVEHVVAPSLYHHLFAGGWRAAYPGAALYGPAALARKRNDLKLSAPLEEAAQAPWAAALVPVHIDGTLFDETVFFHRATRTLVASDLVENFGTSPHLPTRLYLKAAGIHGKAGIAAPLKLLYRDRTAARKSIDAVLALDFDRMVVAHGDILREGGKSAVRSTYEFLGG